MKRRCLMSILSVAALVLGTSALLWGQGANPPASTKASGQTSGRGQTAVEQTDKASQAAAQDPVKVDPKHYKVEFENDQVRVLRIQYGPHEKSVMHDHPDSVAVFLTDQNTRFTLPEGTTKDVKATAGNVAWSDAGKHLPENLSDKPFELVLVELKHSAPAQKGSVPEVKKQK